MKCKLTGTEGKGIKAHIIPKSFYVIDPNETQSTRLVTNAKGHFPQKVPIGIYDDTIVTDEGERIFSEWDDYACDLLLNNRNKFEELKHDGRVVAFQLSNYDYTKLKLFFLSVLWRASTSCRPFFRRVDLGPFEPEVRKALLSQDPKNTDWMAICLAKWSDNPKGAAMMDPFRTHFEGRNYYVMYLEHYIVYFKVDKRVAKNPLRALQLNPSAPLIAVGRELKESKEFKSMIQLVTQRG